MFTANIEISVTENGRKAPQYTLDGDLSGELTLAELLAFTKQSLILIADEVLSEEQAMGFDKTPVVVVDGRQNKAVADVSPIGKIEFVARADIGDILTETYQAILDRSPVLTGTYKASNYVFWNGRQVATDMAALQSWLDSEPNFDDKDLIRFVDIQPYARKLEREGITAQRTKTRTVQSRDKRKAAQGVKVLAPNGVYYLTTRAIRNKYKNNSTIAFEFISGSQLGIQGGFAKKPGKKSRTYLYPSILISVQENGVTNV